MEKYRPAKNKAYIRCSYPSIQSDLVYVASQGTVHGNNNERGVYKSVTVVLTGKEYYILMTAPV
jgi:hypothetical protein